VVASFGTYSTGINIVNLHNIIFSSPTKSKIRSLQSIGRGLRRGGSKESCVLYDFGDLIYKTNYSYKHFVERLKIYDEESFKVKKLEVKING
jgi:superfamily II DNA or RNA helicase